MRKVKLVVEIQSSLRVGFRESSGRSITARKRVEEQHRRTRQPPQMGTQETHLHTNAADSGLHTRDERVLSIGVGSATTNPMDLNSFGR